MNVVDTKYGTSLPQAEASLLEVMESVLVLTAHPVSQIKPPSSGIHNVTLEVSVLFILKVGTIPLE